jgi:hypothetical protein
MAPQAAVMFRVVSAAEYDAATRFQARRSRRAARRTGLP